MSSTVGVFLAAGSGVAGVGPAGFDPDDAGFFLPKSGMSTVSTAATALFSRTRYELSLSLIHSLFNLKRLFTITHSFSCAILAMVNTSGRLVGRHSVDTS